MKTIVRKFSPKPSLLFLLGFPRSGTNFLKSILGTHSLINTLNEPFSLHSIFFVEKDGEVWTQEDYRQIYYHEELKSQKIAFELTKALKRIFEQNKKDIYLIKETNFLLKLGWLKKYLKRIKIILLIRNPFGVIASFKRYNLFNKWNYSLKIQTLFKERNENLRDYKLLFKKVNKKSNVSKLTLLWIIKNLEALRNLFRFKNIVVKYEDLLNNPISKLREIMKFINLGVERRQIEFIKESQLKNLGKNMYSVFRRKKEEKVTELSIKEIKEISDLLACANQMAKMLGINFEEYFNKKNIKIIPLRKTKKFAEKKKRKKFTFKNCFLAKEALIKNIKNNLIEIKNNIYLSLPITNSQFCCFLNAQEINNKKIRKYINIWGERCRIKYYKNRWGVEEKYENHPCTYVTWFGALDFCNWIEGKLPNKELIFEILKRIKFSQRLKKLINIGEKKGDTLPITYFKDFEIKNKSKLIFFLVGNVWKWTMATRGSLVSYKYGGGFNSPFQQWNLIKKRPKLLDGSNLGFQIIFHQDDI